MIRTRLAAACAALAMMVTPAMAQELIWRTYCNQHGDCVQRQVPGPRVYSYERRRREEGRHCRDVRRATGDQHITVDGAKKAANDAWAGSVRFHHGEMFMDLNNARHLTYTCSRSSIKEAGSSMTTLGQALTRCELEAQPCAPDPEREKEGRE